MLTIERRIGGLLRYRKIWFAGHDAIVDASRSLRPNEVVRFFAVPHDLRALPLLINHKRLQTAWIDLSAGPDEILNGMKKKSCRYEIRRAEKMLDRVEIEINSLRAQSDFLLLYNHFAKSRKLPRFPEAWLKEYSTHGDVFVLYLEGRALCCHLLLRDLESRIVRLLHSGSRRLQTTQDAAACGALNRYLHWHEMQRYHSQGFVTFDFGGIRHPDESISRFKLSFGGSIMTEHYYLFGGSRLIANLGNFVYERVLRRHRPVENVSVSGAAPNSSSSQMLQ